MTTYDYLLFGFIHFKKWSSKKTMVNVCTILIGRIIRICVKGAGRNQSVSWLNNISLHQCDNIVLTRR